MAVLGAQSDEQIREQLTGRTIKRQRDWATYQLWVGTDSVILQPAADDVDRQQYDSVRAFADDLFAGVFSEPAAGTPPVHALVQRYTGGGGGE